MLSSVFSKYIAAKHDLSIPIYKKEENTFLCPCRFFADKYSLLICPSSSGHFPKGNGTELPWRINTAAAPVLTLRGTRGIMTQKQQLFMAGLS